MADIPSGMSPQTFEYVLAFTKAHEGATPFMYNNWPLKNANKDVTVGVGLAVANENEAASEAIRSLFIVKATGAPASDPEMRKEFQRVNDLPRTAGNLFTDYQDKSPLAIPQDKMLRMLRDRMLEFWGQSGQSFPNFAALPAQAQVALMSYNYGLRLRGAPKMCDAVRAGNFVLAAEQSRINDWDQQKNEAHKRLFLNAAAIVKSGGDLSKLPPINGPFKPPPAEPGGPTTLNDVHRQLEGKWYVAIGNWKGFFFFDANGGAAWTEIDDPQRHAGRWSVNDGRLEWKFRDPGDFRTFTVSAPLDTAQVSGTILPAGQGWFKMSKSAMPVG